MTTPERAARPDDVTSGAAARPQTSRGASDASAAPLAGSGQSGSGQSSSDTENFTQVEGSFRLKPAPAQAPASTQATASTRMTASRNPDAPTTATVTSGQAALKAMQQAFSSAENPTPKAGRNLFQAVGVGVLLGALVLCSLLIIKQIFMAVIIMAVGAAVWEVRAALTHRQVYVPLVPISIGSLAMVISAALNGPEGTLVALAATLVTLVLWRAVDGGGAKALRDILAGLLVLFWVPLMASFAVFMLLDEQGAQRVLIFLLVPIANDTVGYIVGSRLGKHPLLPSVSPKKSWEGFVGSLLGGTAVAVASTMLLLDAPYWVGLIMGPLVVLVATMGDLCESLIKRDLGVKDMGNLLPGHGGVMDRLDSILLVAPLMYFLMDILI